MMQLISRKQKRKQDLISLLQEKEPPKKIDIVIKEKRRRELY